MSKRTTAFFILGMGMIIMIFTSCKKLDLAVDVPDCVEKKIEQINDEPVRNPPAEVWQWKVDGETYYYITSDCCDQYNYLYDNNCNQICAPDGGISGAGDGNCPIFSGSVEKVLVWKDER